MIFRLARLQIKSHRLRTGFVAVAVVLTTVLYMTVISFAYCAVDSVQLSRMLAFVSDSHALISDAGYSISGEALREEIQSAPEVSETFLVSLAPVHWEEPAEANSAEQRFGVAFVDREKVLPHFFMTLTEGRFPRTGDITLPGGIPHAFHWRSGPVLYYERVYPRADGEGEDLHGFWFLSQRRG